jgi:hypothetical protein
MSDDLMRNPGLKRRGKERGTHATILHRDSKIARSDIGKFINSSVDIGDTKG